jgi:type III pantothenate kinase
MILCLDAGNTRLKWGLHDGSGWRATGILDPANLSALPPALPGSPDRMLACNVAGSEVAGRIIALAAALGVPLDWFRSSPAACGVTNGYARPEQLGADRWAALVGARGWHDGSALVVMAGTATTIDVLDSDGQFRGGLILPGIDMMCAALALNTAGLPAARGSYADLPDNTDDAIRAGALHATLGAIGRMAEQAHRFATGDFRVLLSGGGADALAPHLDLPVRRVGNLVLEGLARFAASTGKIAPHAHPT